MHAQDAFYRPGVRCIPYWNRNAKELGSTRTDVVRCTRGPCRDGPEACTTGYYREVLAAPLLKSEISI